MDYVKTLRAAADALDADRRFQVAQATDDEDGIEAAYHDAHAALDIVLQAAGADRGAEAPLVLAELEALAREAVDEIIETLNFRFRVPKELTYADRAKRLREKLDSGELAAIPSRELADELARRADSGDTDEERSLLAS